MKKKLKIVIVACVMSLGLLSACAKNETPKADVEVEGNAESKEPTPSPKPESIKIFTEDGVTFEMLSKYRKEYVPGDAMSYYYHNDKSYIYIDSDLPTNLLAFDVETAHVNDYKSIGPNLEYSGITLANYTDGKVKRGDLEGHYYDVEVTYPKELDDSKYLIKTAGQTTHLVKALFKNGGHYVWVYGEYLDGYEVAEEAFKLIVDTIEVEKRDEPDTSARTFKNDKIKVNVAEGMKDYCDTGFPYTFEAYNSLNEEDHYKLFQLFKIDPAEYQLESFEEYINYTYDLLDEYAESYGSDKGVTEEETELLGVKAYKMILENFGLPEGLAATEEDYLFEIDGNCYLLATTFTGNNTKQAIRDMLASLEIY